MKPELIALRREMQAHGIDYYMIRSEDFHGSEYVGDHFKCRAFVSGFTGSAGTLLVGPDMAGLWTDGRYFLQAEQQLAGNGIDLFRMRDPGVPTLEDYLKSNMKPGQCLGYDGRTVSAGLHRKFLAELVPSGITLCTSLDLAGMIWTNRPALSAHPAWELPLSCAGRSRAQKLADVRNAMQEKQADALILTSLDDIAWLLNMRGDDVACNPVALSWLAITASSATLFINPSILSEALAQTLIADNIALAPYEGIYDYIRSLGAGKLWLNLNRANSAILEAVPASVTLFDAPVPTELAKAIKNDTELAGIRAAHIKDGAAVTRFMAFLKSRVGTESMTELSLADTLEEFRGQQPGYLGPSFAPIVGYGPHGAIVHYSADEQSCAEVKAASLLLIDSGGQYTEGTTDITRTFALGEISAEQKHHFTLVLRSHLQLASLLFRAGCTGAVLDGVARAPMWRELLDYNHGTGHGIGHVLNVHEGPQSIGWHYKNDTVFEPGMVVSNEPGLYLTGKYGIRHENLMACTLAADNEFGRFLGFETLTFVPFDLDAVEPALLTQAERAQLNAYHAQVREKLLPLMVTEAERGFLIHATRSV